LVILKKTALGVSQRALALFTGEGCRLAGLSGEVDVLVTDSDEMRQLNQRFRGKDKPTDVLSFPAIECSEKKAAKKAARIGDIAISFDIALENARRLGHSPVDELKVLILHGILHLAGYDHDRDNGQMARVEDRLRRSLKLPHTLIARTAQPPIATMTRTRRGPALARSKR
jgi:probable rRNA maturation factor